MQRVENDISTIKLDIITSLNEWLIKLKENLLFVCLSLKRIQVWKAKDEEKGRKNGIINFNLDQQEYIEEKKQIKFYNEWKENEKKILPL